jgi:hypothetical protein
MRVCFVSTTRGSYFMTELLGALARATRASGHEVELAFDGFPPLDDDLRYVVVPHEFDAWGLQPGFPDAAQRARTVALCTENPGTQWFEDTYRVVAEFGAAASINRSSATELRRRGIPCKHVQLGYCASWDTWAGDDAAPRPIDVLYLGAADPRRDPLLAGIGASLWSRECQFLVPPLEPRTAPRPDFLKEGDKHRRLAHSKILLNLHRTTSAAFEWMRFLEAISNGCVVVSEPSLDADPLIAGQHFIEAPIDRIAAEVNALLDDRERLSTVRDDAYLFVREHLPIAPAGRLLGELAAELPRAPTPSRAPTLGVADMAHGATPANRAPLDISEVLAPLGASGLIERSGTGAGESLLARVGGLLRGHRGARGAGDVAAETPSYRACSPRVSVLGVIPTEREDEAVQLLASIAASRFDALEILVAAPGASRRGSLARLLARHPEIAMMILRAETSGLADARNRLIERARGEHLLAAPVGGGVFPTTLKRLDQALESDPSAAFAYPMVAVVDAGVPVGLRGSMPWEGDRLARENWIDTPALIRRTRLLELGGYAIDERLSGLEDFDLWCRIADSAARGIHVPQVLAWHSRRDNAEPADLASLDPERARLLQERAPRLFAAVGDAS